MKPLLYICPKYNTHTHTHTHTHTLEIDAEAYKLSQIAYTQLSGIRI